MKKKGKRCPCFCPFHEEFKPLFDPFFKNRKLGELKCTTKQNKMVFNDVNQFRQHCENVWDWRHKTLIMFLERLYQDTKPKKYRDGLFR